MIRVEERVGAMVVDSDYYAILGVSPSAEDVVIRAAYRALIRHYHPDSNPDPEAQAQARAITEAYNVLRDRERRAEYDAGRSSHGEDWWSFEEQHRPPARPPMRSAGIAAAGLAIVMVAAVWAWPHRGEPARRIHVPVEVRQPPKAMRDNRQLMELQPEDQRLAKLAAMAGVPAAQEPVEPIPTPQAEPEPLPPPVSGVPHTAALASRPAAQAPSQRLVAAEHVEALPVPQAPPAPVREATVSRERPKLVAARSGPSAADKDRLATLERISVGFYNQSMQHADFAKKELLLSAHIRFSTRQDACRSDSCVADSYARQIREVSAIMENRPLPPQ